MNTITISRGEAVHMISLYRRCRDAERFFEACQPASYRHFIEKAFREKATREAFEALARRLAEPQEGEVRRSGKKGAPGKEEIHAEGERADAQRETDAGK